ncbi:1315_t:CDS:2, partial [Ambispora gerdemannii]
EIFSYYIVSGTNHIHRQKQSNLIYHQYSVTDYSRIPDAEKGQGIPGIFFKYDIEPISVRITEKYTFLTISGEIVWNRGWNLGHSWFRV